MAYSVPSKSRARNRHTFQRPLPPGSPAFGASRGAPGCYALFFVLPESARRPRRLVTRPGPLLSWGARSRGPPALRRRRDPGLAWSGGARVKVIVIVIVRAIAKVNTNSNCNSNSDGSSNGGRGARRGVAGGTCARAEHARRPVPPPICLSPRESRQRATCVMSSGVSPKSPSNLLCLPDAWEGSRCQSKATSHLILDTRRRAEPGYMMCIALHVMPRATTCYALLCILCDLPVEGSKAHMSKMSKSHPKNRFSFTPRPDVGLLGSLLVRYRVVALRCCLSADGRNRQLRRRRRRAEPAGHVDGGPLRGPARRQNASSRGRRYGSVRARSPRKPSQLPLLERGKAMMSLVPKFDSALSEHGCLDSG